MSVIKPDSFCWEDGGIELDPGTHTVRVDWHGYALDQVDTWADRVVEAAWKHGLRYVEFVHGAADVAARGTIGHDSPTVAGRGTVKDLLRKRLYRGQWRRWAESVRDGNHQIEEGRMLIALLDNPRPDSRSRWPVIPPPAYGVAGP
jgi:hypothetical protein